MRVLFIDRAGPGAGASGASLGALACHMPDHWNAKKQYQFDALLFARSFWPDLEGLAGAPTGYRQAGRWMPIMDGRAFALAKEREKAASQNWRGEANWRMDQGESVPFLCARGVIRETLSAILDPGLALHALDLALQKLGVERAYGYEVSSLQPPLFEARVARAPNRYGAYAHGARASEIHAENIIIAAGYDALPFIRAYLGADFGAGVKGQGAIIEPKAASIWNKRKSTPLLTGDGYLIVPLGEGRLAIGATSEKRFTHFDNDQKLDDLLVRIQNEVDGLGGARMIAKFAGIRPRADRPDPLIGALAPGIFVHSCGFKTGFGFAPLLARDLMAMITGQDPKIPKQFFPTPSTPDPGNDTGNDPSRGLPATPLSHK